MLDEATLSYNNTVNKSTGFSPFKSIFGTNATLPLDAVCGINPAQEVVSSQLVQANANKNRIEAQTNYKDQGQKDFAACTKPRNFQFSATNRDFLRFPRQIAKFPILRDKSRFFQSSAKNCAFSFKSEDQICAFSFKSEDQVCVFSIKSAGQMSRFLQVLSK